VFIPLGHYMLEAPGMFWYRAASRTVSDDGQPITGMNLVLHDVGVFLMNNWNAALAFNVRGDSTFVNALQFAPFLDTLTGIMFLVGLGLAVRAIVRRGDVRWLIVLLSFPVLFLSSTLALGFPIENPSVNRAGPALPVTFALVGLGITGPMRAIYRRYGTATRILAAGVLAAGFMTAAVENYERYFIRFDAQYWNFVLDATEVANAVRSELDDTLPVEQVYVVTWPYWFDTRLMAISLGNIRWAASHSISNVGVLPRSSKGDMLVVLNPEDQRDLQAIASRWPDASARLVQSVHPGRNFFLVRFRAD
jgi:hypothetical protein